LRFLFGARLYLGNSTSNMAEYSALILALTIHTTLGSSQVEIRSDSELLVRQQKHDYKITSERLKKLDSIVFDLGCSFSKVDYQWIERKKNKIADCLANRAARLTGECLRFNIAFETLN
jgi:ribonuclease HI